MGILLIVFQRAGFLFVRNNPEELGCAPDNGTFTPEEIGGQSEGAAGVSVSWTPAKLVANKRSGSSV